MNACTGQHALTVGPVTITISALILAAAAGTTVSNQASLSFDADGNGSNESMVLTNDPRVAGTNNPMRIQIATLPDVPVPILTTIGLLMLAPGLLGLVVLLRTRRRLS